MRTVERKSGAMIPVLLLAMLGLAVIGLGHIMAPSYGLLQDFPYGP